MADHLAQSPLLPFLKWAGGKRWFVRRYDHLLPCDFRTYIEPFLGGGAVFFALKPQSAILTDSNQALIETYKAIREDWRLVWHYLLHHQKFHSKEYYYNCRNKIFHSPFLKAAQFVYLNRACWNGLYRVNLQGVFNVPIGTKDTIIFDNDDFESISECLGAANIDSCDFENTIDLSGKNDFIFVDPPYTVNHNSNGFRKYNERIFTWEDQRRLRSALERARLRGAKILLTNADHESVRNLYAGFGEITALPRHSVIGGGAEYRKLSSELAGIIHRVA